MINVVIKFIFPSTTYLEVEEPSQDFLVGKTVEGTSQTVKTSRVGEVRISQSRANQVSGVGTDVTTFVITMDGEVTSDAFHHFELFVTHHLGVVTSPINIVVNGDDLSVLL